MKYAVAAGGGGFTGGVQAGAIMRLDEAGIRPSLGFGISVGSLNAAMWMQGDVDKLVDMWETIRFEDIFGPKRNIVSAYLKGGLHSNGPLKKLIDKYIDPDRLPDTFHAGIVDLSTRTYVAASKRNGWHNTIKTAILASTAVPVTHQYVRHGGDAWVDGGLWNVLPVGHLVDIMNRDVGDDGLPNDHLIVLSCQPEEMPEGRRYEISRLDDVAVHSVGMMIDKSSVQSMREFRRINYLCKMLGGTIPREDGGGVYRYIPATVIQPEISLGSGMDARREHLDTLFQMGYDAAEKALRVA